MCLLTGRWDRYSRLYLQRNVGLFPTKRVQRSGVDEAMSPWQGDWLPRPSRGDPERWPTESCRVWELLS